MHTVTTTREVRTIDEFSQESQQAIIDKNRDLYVTWLYEWYDSTLEDFAAVQDDIFDGVKVHFRGFHSQGDGASFDCTSIDIEAFVNKFKNGYPLLVNLYSKKSDIMLDTIDRIHANIHTNGYSIHYCHSNTRYIEVETDYIDVRIEKVLTEELNRLEIEMTLYYRDLCDDLYNILSSEYSDITSDDSIKRHYLDYDYTFYSDDLSLYTCNLFVTG